MNPSPYSDHYLTQFPGPIGQTAPLLSAVDLFCGIGGLTHGLILSGVKVNAGVDSDGTCRYVYEQNNQVQFIARDIREVSSSMLEGLFSRNTIRLLAGCAPCQPFSSHTRKNKNRKKDSKWGLIAEFQRLVRGVSPEIIAVENVPSLQSQGVFAALVSNLHELGYHVYQNTVYCPDYGIPQTRRRLVLLASQFGPISLISNTHSRSERLPATVFLGDSAREHSGDPRFPQTVYETIGTLPAIRDGETSSEDSLHRARKLSALNKERIKQSRPGGTWLDWEPSLRAPCHKKASGQSYKSVYARMSWKEPAPTVTTQFYNFGTGRFGHPEQDRALSLREGALLQTFPKSYDLIDPSLPISFQRLGTHIGNALPVRLASIIGRSICEHLELFRNG